MINRIRKLQNSVSNKIAAGEVVERPASVVKELLENSIDANSTSIVIEIKDAGKALIRVSDNGKGIHREDVELAFERHATSKIYSDEDIYDIKSLGFRGEALASIASVSNVEVITKTTDDEYGLKAELMNGQIIRKSSLGCPIGTTIIVKDLFYNTPARFKFLKSNSAEVNAISSIVNNIALSHPEISFRYIVNNKNIFTTQGNSDLYNTIFTIYGREIARSLIEINSEDKELKIRGYISNTSYTRGNRQLQTLFVNGRYVKSRVITRAIDNAYNTLIPHNRYPVCFLYIEIPTSKVDVNIHPAKTEIRIHDGKRASEFIYQTLKDELLNSNLIPSVTINKVKNVEFHDNILSSDISSKEDTSEQITLVVNKSESEVINEEIIIDDTPKNEVKYSDNKENDYIKDNIVKEKNKYNFDKVFEGIFNEKKQKKDQIKQIKKARNTQEHLLENIKVIGQLFSTYILCEKGDEMLLIDQHAAHERILYESFFNDYLDSEIISQILLDPIIVELNYLDKDIIMENKNIFSRLGYKIEEFGYNTVILREVPIMFGAPVAKRFFREVAEKLNDDSKNGYEFKLNKIIQLSCKKAIKAADKLENIEIEKLIDDLKRLENSFTCPHGRPIIVSISKPEIERKFLRT